MKFKSYENKMKTVLLFGFAAIIASVVISVASFTYAQKIIDQENQNVYVLQNNVPIAVQRTSINMNRPAEYRAHINLFHSLFFNLPPDEKFIQKNMEKAMYLIDDTGMMEYNNRKEKGYYGRILASSAVLSLSTDSIIIKDNKFTYYGKQRIDRKSSVLTRNLITIGTIRDLPRTEQNSHGVLIEDWRTIENSDLSEIKKREF